MKLFFKKSNHSGKNKIIIKKPKNFFKYNKNYKLIQF